MLSFMIHTLETMKVVINAEKMTTHWRWLSSLFLQYRYLYAHESAKKASIPTKNASFLFWTSAKFLVKKKKILFKKITVDFRLHFLLKTRDEKTAPSSIEGIYVLTMKLEIYTKINTRTDQSENWSLYMHAAIN